MPLCIHWLLERQWKHIIYKLIIIIIIYILGTRFEINLDQNKHVFVLHFSKYVDYLL